MSFNSKANQTQSALTRLAKYLTKDTRKIFLDSFITAQFSYLLLIRICHSRNLRNKINKRQGRALRTIDDGYISNVKGLLEQDYSFTIHTSNIQYNPIEVKLKMVSLSCYYEQYFSIQQISTNKISFNCDLVTPRPSLSHY